MKRTFALLILGLTLTLGAAGCAAEQMPDVTPTPTPIITPDMPDATHESAAPSPSDMPAPSAGDEDYHAGADGQVDGSDDMDNPAKDIVDGAGDAVKDAADGVGDAAKDIVDGAGKAMEDMGKGVERAVK